MTDRRASRNDLPVQIVSSAADGRELKSQKQTVYTKILAHLDSEANRHETMVNEAADKLAKCNDEATRL